MASDDAPACGGNGCDYIGVGTDDVYGVRHRDKYADVQV